MNLRRSLLMLMVAALLLAGFLLLVPFGPGTETFVDIPASSSSAQMAAELRQNGIIRSRYAFQLLRLVARLVRGGTLHPGEYRFDHPLPLTEVYTRIAHGDIYTVTLVVPEGYNLFDIAQAVQSAGLGTRSDFLSAARQHVELIQDLAPHADSLEGYLFPATYRFPRRATPLQMLTAMTRRFHRAATQLGLDQGADRQEVNRIVILASLIEKEVSQDAERPVVAGVFLNRLAQNMPLQTDPAVVYAALLEDRYRGTIYRSDLDSPSPYNTYKHAGLPPGPICNPGMAAFRAALHPTPSDLLYFVSDGAGHTRFSATLAEHQQQVEAYRNAVRRP